MNYINNSKRQRIFDFIVLAIMCCFYVYISQKQNVKMNLLFFIRVVLLFWLTIIGVTIFRFLHYMASVDIDLTKYKGQDLNNIEIPYKYKYSEWKQYIINPFKSTLPIAAVLVLVRFAYLFVQIPINVYLGILIMLMFIYIAMFGLMTTMVIGEFTAKFVEKYKLKTDKTYDKKQILKSIEAGLILGILFVGCLIYFFTMSKFHYFLYYFAFSTLFSLSKILIELNVLFSSAVRLVLGHKFDEISLIRRNS